MKNFNMTRFINVAKWDLTINSSFYLKAVFMIFVLMALPLIFSVTGTLFAWMFSGEFYPESVQVTSLGGMFTAFIYALPLFGGYTFHNLLTRQSRINELTLPSTNFERFTWHVLLTIVGAVLVAMLSMVVIDVIQFVYVGSLAGFDSAKSVILNMGDNFKEVAELFKQLPHAGTMTTIITLGYFIGMSVFVLGNAVKYRHNIILTILFKMAVGIVLFLIFAVSVTMLKNYLFEQGHIYSIDNVLSSLPIGEIVITIQVLVLALCWWLSYRFYSRAQITTKRNR